MTIILAMLEEKDDVVSVDDKSNTVEWLENTSNTN